MVHPCALHYQESVDSSDSSCNLQLIQESRFCAQIESFENGDGSLEPDLVCLHDTEADNDGHLETFLPFEEQIASCEQPGEPSTSEENNSDDDEGDDPVPSAPTHTEVLSSFLPIRTYAMLKGDEEMSNILVKMEGKYQASKSNRHFTITDMFKHAF